MDLTSGGLVTPHRLRVRPSRSITRRARARPHSPSSRAWRFVSHDQWLRDVTSIGVGRSRSRPAPAVHCDEHWRLEHRAVSPILEVHSGIRRADQRRVTLADPLSGHGTRPSRPPSTSCDLCAVKCDCDDVRPSTTRSTGSLSPYFGSAAGSIGRLQMRVAWANTRHPALPAMAACVLDAPRSFTVRFSGVRSAGEDRARIPSGRSLTVFYMC